MNKQIKRIKSIQFEYIIIFFSIGILFLIEKLDRSIIDVKMPTFILKLPEINAYINIIVSFLICLGIITAKKNNYLLHRFFMKLTFFLSILFFIFFMLHIITTGKIIYGDIDKNGLLSFQEAEAIFYTKYIYYFILSTHIICASLILPFILITYYKGFNKDYKFHKKIAKFTYPIWLYVTITGPIVFFMIK